MSDLIGIIEKWPPGIQVLLAVVIIIAVYSAFERVLGFLENQTKN